MPNNFADKKWGSVFDFLELIDTLEGMKEHLQEKSKTIFNCTAHLCTLSGELYEDLHDDLGYPLSLDEAKVVIASYQKKHQDEIATILEV